MAEGGTVNGEELECPFHMWRFCGETGKCTSVPYSEKSNYFKNIFIYPFEYDIQNTI